jgi:hypothetical protein
MTAVSNLEFGQNLLYKANVRPAGNAAQSRERRPTVKMPLEHTRQILPDEPFERAAGFEQIFRSSPYVLWPQYPINGLK